MSVNHSCWPCGVSVTPDLKKLRLRFWLHLLGFVVPICLAVLGFFLLIGVLHEMEHVLFPRGKEDMSSAHLVREQPNSSFSNWIPSALSSELAARIVSPSSSSSTDLASQKQEGHSQRTEDPADSLIVRGRTGLVLFFVMPVAALGFSLYTSISTYTMTYPLAKEESVSLPLSHSSGSHGLCPPRISMAVVNLGQLVAMCLGWVAWGFLWLWSIFGEEDGAWVCLGLTVVVFAAHIAFYYLLLNRLFVHFTNSPAFSSTHVPIADSGHDRYSDTALGYHEDEVVDLQG